MIILLHSSKTMRSLPNQSAHLQTPQFLQKSIELDGYLKSLSHGQIKHAMRVSDDLAKKTHNLIANWGSTKSKQTAAIDSFVGDIYSGLQADSLDQGDRQFANQHLRILSGLYGILRPLDDIHPYRLEMGYRLDQEPYNNLYTFWGNSIARALPNNEVIVNTSSNEYMRTVLPFVDADKVITPRFLTVNPTTHEPTFVVVHAKIARGAFARWLIKNRVTNPKKLIDFDDLGYDFSQKLSKPNEPVFVCQQFGGIGLSMRLK